MTTEAIRERLYDYIRQADDKKIRAIYTMLEDQIITRVDWDEDEDFVRELNDRVRKYQDGTEPGVSLSEVRRSLGGRLGQL